MLFQIDIVKEWQFLLYLTAIIIGLQLAIYFFYQYLKIKDEKLQQNKILLSYGSFFLLGIVGAFFLILNRYFVVDSASKELINKIAYAVVLFSPIAFLHFINIAEFSNILKLKLGRLLMVLSLIPIIVLMVVPSTSQIFRVIVVLTLINAIYVIIFQLRLIKISLGTIKRRLISLFIGEIMTFISLFFNSEIPLSWYQPQYINSLIFLGIALFIIGLVIILTAIFRFPPFLEVNWQLNLLKLFVINQKDNVCLYTHEFRKSEENLDESRGKQDNLLFSGGISGIDSIISAITNTKTEKINTIKQGDSYILLDYGTKFPVPIVFALVVKQNLNSIRYFLSNIKLQFESFYKEILLNFEMLNLEGKEAQLFESYDIILKNLM